MLYSRFSFMILYNYHFSSWLLNWSSTVGADNSVKIISAVSKRQVLLSLKIKSTRRRISVFGWYKHTVLGPVQFREQHNHYVGVVEILYETSSDERSESPIIESPPQSDLNALTHRHTALTDGYQSPSPMIEWTCFAQRKLFNGPPNLSLGLQLVLIDIKVHQTITNDWMNVLWIEKII